MKFKNKGGFISTIVIIIVAIVLLKVWFDFDIFKWLKQPEVKSILLEIRDVIVLLWQKYFKEAVLASIKAIKELGK